MAILALIVIVGITLLMSFWIQMYFFRLFVAIGSLWTHVDCTDLNLLLGLSTIVVGLVFICWAIALFIYRP